MWKMAAVLIPLLIIIFILFYFLLWNIRKIFEAFKINVPKKIFYISGYLLFAFLIWSRSVLIVMMLYSFIMFAAAELVRMILVKLGVYKRVHRLLHIIYQNGVTVLVIGLLLSIYAAYSARHLVVTEYDINVNKAMEKEVCIGYISDVHMGSSVGQKEINELTDRFIDNNPDIICLGGDIFDESTTSNQVDMFCEMIQELSGKYPVYFVKGNHDDSVRDNYIEKLQNSGAIFLDDSYVVTHGICLLGRTDEGMGSERTKKVPVSDIIQDEVKNMPIVVLNHRPVDLSEEEDNNIDLVISGHTHNGQLFPGNLFIEVFNDLGYGRLDRGDFHAVVSSGVGTWYFPVRTVGYSEMVMIHLNSEISGK